MTSLRHFPHIQGICSLTLENNSYELDEEVLKIINSKTSNISQFSVLEGSDWFKHQSQMVIYQLGKFLESCIDVGYSMTAKIDYNTYWTLT